jgi:hypothetical protein
MRGVFPSGLAGLVFLALAGCAGNPSAGGPPAVGDAPAAMTPDVLAKVATHHVQDVYGLLGQPQAIQKIADGANYTWAVTETTVIYVPNSTAKSSGFIGLPPPGTDTSPGGKMTHEVTCRLRITSDAAERIRNVDFHGPRNACEPASRQFAQWVNAAG